MNTKNSFENCQYSFINQIDAIKGLAIYLVVLGHCVTAGGEISKIIFSFHMPLFFMIAGYLFNYEKYKDKFTFFVKRKAYRLLIPYFLCCSLFFLHWFTFECPNPIKDTPLFAINNILIKSIKGCIYGIGIPNRYKPLCFDSVGPLWFLPCLFVGMLFLYIFVKMFDTKSYLTKLIILTLCILGGVYISKFIFLPWSIDISLVAIGFLYTGYLLRKNVVVHFFYNKTRWIIIGLLFIYVVCFTHSLISMNNRDYHNIIYAYFAAISISLVIFLLIKKLPYKVHQIFSCGGGNSLIILCFHNRIQYLTPDFSWIKYNSFIESAYLTLFCLAIAIVINRIPILNNFFGNTNKLRKKQ